MQPLAVSVGYSQNLTLVISVDISNFTRIEKYGIAR